MTPKGYLGGGGGGGGGRGGDICFYFRVLNRFDPDQDQQRSVLIWIQTVCKGYQEMTKVIT